MTCIQLKQIFQEYVHSHTQARFHLFSHLTGFIVQTCLKALSQYRAPLPGQITKCFKVEPIN